jgi:polyphosphate glucokinase
MKVLGIDVGGSGIKAAVVETVTGELLTERYRIRTPRPATPTAVAKTIKKLVDHFEWNDIVGCGFPAAITHGFARTASNVDKSFINTNIAELFSRTCGQKVYCVNDADAAGEAEVTLGEGKGVSGTIIMVTIGTGLGTAIFVDGELVPNTELGHIYLNNGIEAEFFASDATREREGLKRKEWAIRFNLYLNTLENLFWPDLFILGGGSSKKLSKFSDSLTVKTPVVAASMLNEAGIVGAAIYAQTERKRQQNTAGKDSAAK